MWVTKIVLLLFLTSLYVVSNFAAPADSSNSLVVTSAELSGDEQSGKESTSTEVHSTVPQIYQMHVKSNVSNRFAHTTVTSKVRNEADKAQEATFSVILPESAFISGFIMEVDGKNYTAYVKEKEEAKRTYDQAVASGLGAAHVAVSARDSNRFTVSVNIEPESKAAFYLSYEELLKRQEGRYELVINLHPGQPVKDLSVEVLIAESRKITVLKAPPIRSGNEIGSDKPELDPRADLEIVNDTSAIVRFLPNLEMQKQLAHSLGTPEENGLAGQFVVQYDVERDPNGGEVLLLDGYFVHFFAPSELAPLPKHVVFVLDTSSSMHNRKLQQLKEAMHKILEQLHEQDLFHLVEFNTNTKVWDLDNNAASVWYPSRQERYGWHSEEVGDLSKLTLPSASVANADNIQKAKSTVSKFVQTASTDIYSALQVGLRLVEVTKQTNGGNHQPIIVFLTDGEPTVRITSTDDIVNKVTEKNAELGKTPIFALSFGDGADKNFLQKLALRNSGFSRHIYEAADASLQLQDFYREISSPLLAEVTFKYANSTTSLTKTEFPIHFKGSELVICGRYHTGKPHFPVPAVDAWNGHGKVSFRPTVQRSVTSLERLWAYLTVKQLLEEKEVSGEVEELKKKALDLALQYSFVTSVSSLVVVKPDATTAVDPESAEQEGPRYPHVPANRLSGRTYSSGPTAGSRVSYGSSRPSYHNAVASSGHSVHGSVPNYASYGPQSESYSPRYIGGGGRGGGDSSSRHAAVPSSGIDVGQYHPSSGGTNDLRFGSSSGGGFGHSYKSSSLDDDEDAAVSFVDSSPDVNIAPTSSPSSRGAASDLLTTLPWLRNIVNQNGIISLPMGNYKLGLNESISDKVPCSNAPLSGAGHCKLLNSCPQVYAVLRSVDVFVQHFCSLKNGYAGVCCPTNF